MKKLFVKIFPYDKLLHYMLGTYIAISLKDLISWFWILLIVLVVAILIEVWDKLSEKGNAEILDIIYTEAGAVTVLAILQIINLLKVITV